MAGRRDLVLELMAVLACGAVAAVLFWVLSSWSTLLTLLATAGVVVVAAAVAWRSSHPYAVLGTGIVVAATVAVSQGYVMLRMFAGFCIFEPCPEPASRLASLVDALPLAFLPIVLGMVGLAVLARLRAGAHAPAPQT